MRKALSYTLVVIGLLVLLYPKASEWYEARQQEQLMAEWEDASFDQTAEDEAQAQYEDLTNLFGEEPGNSVEAAVDTADLTTEAPPASIVPSETPKPEAPKLQTIATIKIPSIKLKLPVVEGATQKNMKYAAAHLKETAQVGQVGNAAIAAHRMRAKGKLFNRLGEVKVGDKITIETKDETFTYTVYDVSIVEPTDVSVLNYNDKDKMLTLITCDPIVKPTHRLIVHAKL
ncbi:class D sortase [Paenibacillus harenae]|uniref:Sortase A n=1 Tax=Paenibacillus harenae TaxID=306543 RepID=A0ABT9U867_PAEHA|nr:class D sortase [Paenibacillus harenae]MDQ0058854.1 sortase A [Paenibacillus harenae]MDQ0114399.1 sortase A [Paenibacillus harenae]